MSYNYLLNTLDGSVECEINNSELTNSLEVYNGKIKTEINQPLSNYKNQIKSNTVENLNVNIVSETPSTADKKSRLSDKLKVLLKNGGNRKDKLVLNDPYAFNEGDQHSAELEKKALNNVGTASMMTTASTVATTNIKSSTTNKSIMFPKSGLSQVMGMDETIKVNVCNGEMVNDVKKTSNSSKDGNATTSFISHEINQSAYEMQSSTNNVGHNKMLGLKNGKTAQVHVGSNTKPLLNKLFSKSKPHAIKSSSVIETLKGNRSDGGKPEVFNPSQFQNQGVIKADWQWDKKPKSFQKSNSLLTQLQTTASSHKPGGQQQFRKNQSKGPFFGGNKIVSNQGNSMNELQSNNKTVIKKSLLEESLLGLKNHSVEKKFSNVSRLNSKETEFNNAKTDFSPKMTSNGPRSNNQIRLQTNSLDQGKHESLERIWNIRNKLKGLKRDHHHFGLTINDGEFDDNLNSECLLFQNYWFSVCGDSDTTTNNDRRRDTKLSQLKVELRHKIKQLQWKYKDEYRDKVVELLVESARKQPNLTAFLIRLENSKFNSRKKMTRVKPFNLLRPVLCSYMNPELGFKCQEQAMPCIKFCQQHITQSNDQLLFSACTARRSDNTTCKAAVLSPNLENPLCLEHKRLMNKSDMPKNSINSIATQPRKRSRSSTGSSSRSGRSRKRRRSSQKDKREISNGSVRSSNSTTTTITTDDSSSNFNFGKEFVNNNSFKHQNISDKSNPLIISKCDVDESHEVEVGEEVLAIAEDLPLELASQATKLLEEHDFTNVLNHIPADAFNDLFTEDKEEYEPTPQETEELERALAAVDKDVKSLEKLSQTQGILETLLDEQTIAQTLAQLPEVTANIEVPQTLVPVFYQNGFSNINQLEQTLNDVNKSLSQTVMINQGAEGMVNHFNNIAIPNHADVLQS